jgi:Outer membrane protein beta-barrel domain
MIMKNYKFCLTVFLCFFALNLLAQKDNHVQDKKHRFTLYGGVGPNYYFNNLVVAKSYVQPWNYSFVGRLMWEPEHFIGLGIESGYYQLYTVKYPPSYPWHAEVINVAIPVQLVVSMKFLKNYYANISIGQTYLQNKFISQDKGSFESSSWSLADFGITMGYKYPVFDRVSVGAETKFFHSSKNEDNNLALVFMVSYRF